MTIFRFYLIRSMRKRMTLLALIVLPLVILFLPPLWNMEDALGFSFYSLVILFGSFALVRSTMTDRESGLIVRIFAAPVTTLTYLSQSLLAYMLLMLLQVVVFVGIGTALYGWDAYISAMLLLGYILFASTSVSLSLAWNSLFRSKAMSGGVFSILVSFMAILGGVFVPLSMLPDVMQKIGMLFPTYWISSILIGIAGRQPPFGIWTSSGILMMFTAIFLIFGSKRRLE